MNGLIRWKPFSHLMPPRFWDWGREPEDLFESLMELQGSEREMWFPRVETYRKNGTFVVKADLPGVDAKNIHISVDRGLLTIRGERKMDRDVERKNFRGRGMFYGSFQRSLPIPEGLKLDKVKAKYHDGVLEITAPMEKSLPSKEIKIEVEKAA